MANKNNTIMWMIGIVVVVAIVLSQSGGNLGLFSVASPATCETFGYFTVALPDMRNWEEIEVNGLTCWYVVSDKKELCESTGGVWEIHEPEMGCSCQTGLRFHSVYGCVDAYNEDYFPLPPMGVWCVTHISTGEESYKSCQPFNEFQTGMDCYITKQECIEYVLDSSEETVCCKITNIFESDFIQYKWTTDCPPSMILPGGNDYEIVDDSYCEVQEEKCLFTINDYCIKLWMILLGLGAILLIYLSTRKK